MGLDGRAWQRHANPWSVYSRFSVLPLLSLAIWSRVWLGPWCLLLVALTLFWTWYNPRAFPPPRDTRNWASKGTFGERVFLNRAKIPIPQAYLHWGIGLSVVSGIGFIPWAMGLWQFDLALVLLGMVITIGAKTWFVDRMVFLYDEMAEHHPDYRSWLRPSDPTTGARD